MDLLFLAATLLLFGITAALVAALDRLGKSS
jgi:hypothetical protein